MTALRDAPIKADFPRADRLILLGAYQLENASTALTAPGEVYSGKCRCANTHTEMPIKTTRYDIDDGGDQIFRWGLRLSPTDCKILAPTLYMNRL